MDRQKVEVRLGTRVDLDAVVADVFDEVIVATGAEWGRPDWSGATDERVATVDDLAGWLGSSDSEAGRHFVVVGGDKAGIALAMVARERGASVEVLEETAVFATANGLVGRWRYVHDARQAGIQLEGEARVESVSDAGVHWVDARGASRISKADRILIATGAQPDLSFTEALRAAGVSAQAIGDCAEVRLVEGAMESAAEWVLSL